MKPHTPHHRRKLLRYLSAALATSALVLGGTLSAQAYNPGPDSIVELGNSQPCLKGRGNCIIYPKTTQLPSGRLIAAFEKATVGPTGSADNTKMPVYKSDDLGATWQPLTEVGAPAYLSTDAKYRPYISNWTNPNLYVLPQDIGSLKKGTLLLASVVSGEDEYYVEQKKADPNWVPSNDGDRRDMAIALYASTDEGVSWNVVDVVAKGGWQGGSAGNIGGAIAKANTNQQIDPVWEPHLMVRDNKLVTYYSDENDYLGFDKTTGVAQIDPDNDTAPDSGGQVLVHREWSGTGAWSAPIIDVPGLTQDRGNGKTQIGGGRPGMTTVAETTDGKWMMTFEYFGGGGTGRVLFADDPLKFYATGSVAGSNVAELPTTNGSRGPQSGGSPVTLRLPDGRIIFNADGSGDVWVNESGRSDGAWTQRQTPLGAGYSRNLQYVAGSGLVHILQAVWGGATSGAVIRSADVDLGGSVGEYFSLQNKKTGQLLGTGGNTTDARIGNKDQPDVRVETARTDASIATQLWHVRSDLNGTVTLLNKSGGREAAIWTGQATEGQRIASWVDDKDGGLYRVVQRDGGYIAFQSAQNAQLFLTASTPDGAVSLQKANTDGSQDWKLTPETTGGTTPTPVPTATPSPTVTPSATPSAPTTSNPATSPAPQPAALPRATVSSRTVEQGSSVHVNVTGLRAGEQATADLRSTPTTISGIPAADASGTVNFAVYVPASLAVGDHTIHVRDASGTEFAVLAISVVAKGQLAATGAQAPFGAMLLGASIFVAGAALTVMRKRRVRS